MPTLSQWIECDGLPKERCNSYRRLKGLPPLPGTESLQQNRSRQVLSHKSQTSSENGHGKSDGQGFSVAGERSDTQPGSRGPGTSLKKLLKQLGIDSAWCEGCQGRASQMNRWGTEGCRERIDEIAGWLEAAAQEAAHKAAKQLNGGNEPTPRQVRAAHKRQVRAAAWAAITTLTWIDPFDPYRSLVREAIRMAELDV